VKAKIVLLLDIICSRLVQKFYGSFEAFVLKSQSLLYTAVLNDLNKSMPMS
jgi:hypothetical protein